jgi:two-component system, LytTR family, response regulator
MLTYLVDDEQPAIARLTRLLAATGRVTLAGSSTDPVTALEFLRSHPVDLLFLDIQMPGLTGFELLERLDQQQPLVIFTTAYDRYALNAFDANSIDYLLKPIEPERLDRALDKAERLSAARPDVRELARQLAAELGHGRKLERIASRVGERTTILEVARVSHFVSKDKLTFALVNGREHVVDFTLGELEARLDPRRFARIHRAAIVNVTFVQELFPAVDGGMLVRLKDGATALSVARDRIRDLKTRLGI